MKVNKQACKCYRCDADATGNEHVPPRCLFPTQTDVPDDDYRKNLITVPSCDLHNSKKSTDDEFLMLSLAGIVKNNYVGYLLNKTKVRRASERNKTLYPGLVMTNAQEVLYRASNGLLLPLVVGFPNVERLTRCFESIAYGLYWHEYKERFEGKCMVMLGFVEYLDINYQILKNYGAESFDSKLSEYPLKGENPAVFEYQFDKSDPTGLLLLRLVFYGNAEVYICFEGKGAPFNLVHALAGISETITFVLGNGQQVTFRK